MNLFSGVLRLKDAIQRVGGLCGLGASDLIPNGEAAFGAKIDLEPVTHLAIFYARCVRCGDWGFRRSATSCFSLVDF